MMDKKKESDASEQNADIKKVYKADRKTRPAHLIDEDRQRQIERFQRAVVAAVEAREEQKALDYLKQMGYGPESPEYRAVIALLYPLGKKR